MDKKDLDYEPLQWSASLLHTAYKERQIVPENTEKLVRVARNMLNRWLDSNTSSGAGPQ